MATSRQVKQTTMNRPAALAVPEKVNAPQTTGHGLAAGDRVRHTLNTAFEGVIVSVTGTRAKVRVIHWCGPVPQWPVAVPTARLIPVS